MRADDGAPAPTDEPFEEGARVRPRAAADEAAAPELRLGAWEGPLDLLLELARARKVDLARLSILDIAAQFGAALEAAAAEHSVPLARLGDWLVMAAHLALLRSRLLLPEGSREGEEGRREAEALRRRLADREHARHLADWLERRPRLGRDVFARGRTGDESEAREHAAPKADIAALLRACLAVLEKGSGSGPYRPAPLPLWRVPDALARLRRMLPATPEGAALERFLPETTAEAPDAPLQRRAALASTLLAGLELDRKGTRSCVKTRRSALSVSRPPGARGSNPLRPPRGLDVHLAVGEFPRPVAFPEGHPGQEGVEGADQGEHQPSRDGTERQVLDHAGDGLRRIHLDLLHQEPGRRDLQRPRGQEHEEHPEVIAPEPAGHGRGQGHVEARRPEVLREAGRPVGVRVVPRGEELRVVAALQPADAGAVDVEEAVAAGLDGEEQEHEDHGEDQRAVGVESDSESMPATTVMAQFVVRSIRSRHPDMRPISARWKWARALMASVEVEGRGGWRGGPASAGIPAPLRRLSMAVRLRSSGGS
jgi:segregation and condensation protein A